MRFGLNQKQLKVFYGAILLITVPFFLVTLAGIRNESSLILIFPLLLGIPWSYVIARLPATLPGHDSTGMVLDAQGNLTLSIFGLILYLIPIYINIYILSRLIYRDTKKM